MKRAQWLGIAIVGLCALTFAGCGGKAEPAASPAAGKAKGTPLRYNFNNSEAHYAAGDPASYGLKAFTDYLKANGPEVFDVKVFYGNQLAAKIDETLPALKSGGFEVGGEPYGNLGGVTKAFMPLNFPFLMRTWDDAEKYWTGPVGQRMRADAEKDMGIKIIWSMYIGFRNITNSRAPIQKPADMKGLKIRTMNDPYQVAAMGALGASPTPMAWSELFTALQQKVVDAQENPIMNIYNAKMYEVQKYVTKTGHNFTWAGTFVSKDWFDKLPPNAQKLLLDAGAAAEKACFDQLKVVETRMEKELVEKYGMQIYTPTPDEAAAFQKACKSVYEDIRKVIGDDYYNLVMKEMNIK